MKRHFTAISISLSWALAEGAWAATDALTQVPAGFEALVEGQVEQLELQLFNRNLGVHPVLVQPGRIEFKQPERIAALLVEAGVLASPQELLPLLSQPLPSNSQLACSYGLASEASCGYLETEAVAVILDEAGARLQVLLRKDWLPTNEASALRLHTPSEAEMPSSTGKTSISPSPTVTAPWVPAASAHSAWEKTVTWGSPGPIRPTRTSAAVTATWNSTTPTTGETSTVNTTHRRDAWT